MTLIAKVDARFSIDSADYNGTRRNYATPDDGMGDPYAKFRCGECKKSGKERTFRAVTGFTDHLKNYHGAKDGDAVERLL
jgi:hypothetical protein